MEQRIVGNTAPVEELVVSNEADKEILEILYNELNDEDSDGVIISSEQPEGTNGVF